MTDDPDTILKRIMPNLTVMRRYVLGAYLCGVAIGIAGTVLIDRTNDNTDAIETAVCSVVVYAEKQADNALTRANLAKDPKIASSLTQSSAELNKLAEDMRRVVKCAPRPDPTATPSPTR